MHIVCCTARVRSWQILLQKSLPVSVRGDSIALMRFATEAGDDGATQSRSKTAFLFIPARGCGSRRSFGPSDCWGSRPVIGACRARTVLSKAWETFDRSGAYDLATFLRFARNEHSAGTYKSILPTVGFVAFQSKTRFRTIPRSRVHATSGSATPTFSAPYSSVSWKRALGLALSAEKVLQWMPA